jgi:hypothetical protein
VRRDTFSGPVLGQEVKNCGDFKQLSRERRWISPETRLCGGEIEIRTFVTFCAEPLRADVAQHATDSATYTSHPENCFGNRIGENSPFSDSAEWRTPGDFPLKSQVLRPFLGQIVRM